jgi:hypothetical protein
MIMTILSEWVFFIVKHDVACCVQQKVQSDRHIGREGLRGWMPLVKSRTMVMSEDGTLRKAGTEGEEEEEDSVESSQEQEEEEEEEDTAQEEAIEEEISGVLGTKELVFFSRC